MKSETRSISLDRQTKKAEMILGGKNLNKIKEPGIGISELSTF